MTRSAIPHDPPRWAEHLLRACLASRDRDTIAGDLLEEYREVVRPTRGRLAADIWYLTQVLSLIPGVTLGLVLGTAFGISNLIMTAVMPLAEDSPAGLIAFYGPMFVVWGGAGFLAARRTGRLAPAVKVAAMVAAVTFAVFQLTLFVRIALFLDVISHRDDWRNMVASAHAAGFGSLRAYANVVYLLNTPMFILAGTAIGATSGLIGGLLSKIARHGRQAISGRFGQ
jgi:hypothetical protein